MNAILRMIACSSLAVALPCASQASPESPAPTGKLIDLGGHRLHLNCSGKGPVTVVIENGLGDFSFDWILVQQRVEKFTRVCTYDRAGYAWSDPGPKPRSFPQLNLELHDALAKAGERPPFILVGHSYGGGVVRNYALLYRSQVAGMVLVDIVHEDQRIPMGPSHIGRVRDDATGAAIPVPRENMMPSDKPPAPPAAAAASEAEPAPRQLPQEEQQMHLWAEQLPALEDAENSQRQWSAESMALMYKTPQKGSLGGIPLIVLTRAKGGYGNDMEVPAADLEAERLRLQASLVLLSSNGKQILVNSGHNMNLEAPAEVAEAIHAVVLACEKKSHAGH